MAGSGAELVEEARKFGYKVSKTQPSGARSGFLLCDRRIYLSELKSEGVIHEARTFLGNRIMSLFRAEHHGFVVQTGVEPRPRKLAREVPAVRGSGLHGAQ